MSAASAPTLARSINASAKYINPNPHTTPTGVATRIRQARSADTVVILVPQPAQITAAFNDQWLEATIEIPLAPKVPADPTHMHHFMQKRTRGIRASRLVRYAGLPPKKWTP